MKGKIAAGARQGKTARRAYQIENLERRWLLAATVKFPPGESTPLPDAPQTTGTTFQGATLTDTGAFPPDSMGAVGPTQYIVAVNGRIRSFNKSTGLVDNALNADTGDTTNNTLT